ncbi:hypothetical protein L484_008617 [Morus notabilis]|uniref:Uncharacterized protein n=1 Tax=Morus notabilis TaxID=981085 RepID=W9RTY3_9ROSA|nr:hypothetical protein L484_008617 [Morus notabilis]
MEYCQVGLIATKGIGHAIKCVCLVLDYKSELLQVVESRHQEAIANGSKLADLRLTGVVPSDYSDLLQYFAQKGLLRALTENFSVGVTIMANTSVVLPWSPQKNKARIQMTTNRLLRSHESSATLGVKQLRQMTSMGFVLSYLMALMSFEEEATRDMCPNTQVFVTRTEERVEYWEHLLGKKSGRQNEGFGYGMRPELSTSRGTSLPMTIAHQLQEAKKAIYHMHSQIVELENNFEHLKQTTQRP